MSPQCRASVLSSYLGKKGIENTVTKACSLAEDGILALSGAMSSYEIEIGDSYVNLIKITGAGPVYVYVCEKADELLRAINIEKENAANG
jgi:hypothetical protein